jgi:hypothetical protein
MTTCIVEAMGGEKAPAGGFGFPKPDVRAIRRRAWLGELYRIAARLLADAYAATLPGGKPGLILFVQTFGDSRQLQPAHTRARRRRRLPARWGLCHAAGCAGKSAWVN